MDRKLDALQKLEGYLNRRDEGSLAEMEKVSLRRMEGSLAEMEEDCLA